jgi:hypothetical protein
MVVMINRSGFYPIKPAVLFSPLGNMVVIVYLRTRNVRPMAATWPLPHLHESLNDSVAGWRGFSSRS